MLDQIPVLPLSILLSKLPTIDLIKFRIISKKFKNVIDNNVNVKCLIITLSQIPYNEKWYKTYDDLDLNYLIKVKNLDFLQNDLVKLMFGKIKYLFIFAFPESHLTFDLAELNHYSNIKQLELWYLNLKKNTKLCLPRLNTLCINEQTESKIIIESALVHLKTVFETEQLNFKHPLIIKSIQCNRYTPDIKLFTNLEYFCCEMINQLDDDFLIKLKNLKKIQFHDLDQVYYDLKDQKSKLNRHDLEIYFLGINFCLKKINHQKLINNSGINQLKNVKEQDNEFNNIDNDLSNYNLAYNRYHLNDLNLKIYIDNKDRLDINIPFINTFCYNQIINYFKSFNQIPKWFLKIFPICQCIIVNDKIDDLDSFYLFIKQFRPLNSLFIKNTGINQEYLDKISIYCNSLITLSIKKESKIKNYDFIFNLTNLIEFEFDKFIPLNNIGRIFQILKFMETISFFIDCDYISIDKKSDQFDLSIDKIDSDRTEILKNVTLNEIINYLNSNYDVV